MTQESIFAILQEKDVQEQWLNICRLHRITKEYLLVAEEVCEEGVLFFQPLKEHRDAYDHVIRTFSIDLKKVPEDVDCKLYVKKNLEKAYGHEYRAFFDTADWLSYNLRKSIRERLRKMSKREKKEFIQRSGGEAFLERMNQYPFKVAEMRDDKDIGMASNDSPIREYQNILDEMIAIYKSIGE